MKSLSINMIPFIILNPNLQWQRVTIFTRNRSDCNPWIGKMGKTSIMPNYIQVVQIYHTYPINNFILQMFFLYFNLPFFCGSFFEFFTGEIISLIRYHIIQSTFRSMKKYKLL